MAVSAFVNQAIENANAEYLRFDRGNGHETDDPYYRYVGEYWSVGLHNAHINGRTTYQDSRGRSYRPAWSAAFISYIMRKSGAGAEFYYHEGHIHYVVKAIRDAQAAHPTAKFLGRDPARYAPKPGDLINAGRGEARDATFATVLGRYGDSRVPNGHFLPSHTDIVIAVDTARVVLSTIGGNVSVDTVGKKKWTLEANGILKKAAETICVIECLL